MVIVTFDEEADGRVIAEMKISAYEAALTEIQSAAWARSWSRLQQARKRFTALSGIEVRSPLRAELRRAVSDGE